MEFFNPDGMKFGVDFTQVKKGHDDDIAHTWLHEMMHAFLGMSDYFHYDGEDTENVYLRDYKKPANGYRGSRHLKHEDTFNHADTMSGFLREVAKQYVAPPAK
jgi:hypothetical protein